MKKILFLSSLFALLSAACGNRQTESATHEPSIIDSIFHIPYNLDTVGHTDLFLYGIQDSPQTMSADLFRGLDDALLDSLLPDGQAEASFNVFLLPLGDRVVLFDAGIGAAKGGRLMVALDSLGYTPDQITDICITHLHFDHVGGLFNSDGTAAFPAATLHFPQVEYAAWASGEMGNSDITSQIGRTYEGRIEFFKPGDTLVGSIATIAAPGHTPGHTIYEFNNILIAGDIMHAVALQLEHPEFCARFDADPKQAVITRKAILDRVRTEHLTLCGMHFPRPLYITCE